MVPWKEIIKINSLYLGGHFRFILNFIQPTPLEASIKITRRCNSRCITCDVWKNQPKEDELTLSQMENIFHQLKELQIKAIGFTGGEPLLRNDIGQLIERAKKITGAKVYIVTNGFLLSQKAQTLLEKGIDYISVSIDGLEKTNEKIRGVPDHYSRTIEGIQALRKLDHNLKINVGTTLVKPNISEIPQLVEICKKLKVIWSYNLLDTSLYFFKDIDTSELLINDEKSVDQLIDYLYKINKKEPETFLFTNSTCLEFARNYLKNKKPHFNCLMAYLRIYIDSNLDVYSGCWALPPLGNLREENLKDILKSQKYKKRAKMMFDLKCPRCSCGHIISLMINHLQSTVISTFKGFKRYKQYLSEV